MKPMRKITTIILITAMALVMAAGFAKQVKADSYTNNILNVTVSSSDGRCSFRTGPGLSYSMMREIYNGTVLRITALNQNPSDGLVWGQTTYNGYSGWVSMVLMIVNDVENASRAEYDVTVVEPDYIYLRRGPGAEYDELYRPYNGQTLRITQTCANGFDGRPWGKTNINGMTGWVSLDWTYRNNYWTYNNTQDVTMSNNIYYATVSAPDNYLNLRTGPGISNPVIQPIYNGATLYVTATVDNSQDGLVWGWTTYNGRSGWVSMSQTTVTGMQNSSTARYYVAVEDTGNIRLRKGPGSEYDELVSYIPHNTSLYITETVINSFDGRPWGKTNYNGYNGWVSLDWTYRYSG